MNQLPIISTYYNKSLMNWRYNSFEIIAGEISVQKSTFSSAFIVSLYVIYIIRLPQDAINQ